jgi:hypothetical protein
VKLLSTVSTESVIGANRSSLVDSYTLLGRESRLLPDRTVTTVFEQAVATNKQSLDDQTGLAA